MTQQDKTDELALVFEAISDPVILYAADGRVRRANPAAIATCGFDPSGLDPASFIQRLHLRYYQGRLVRPDEFPSRRMLRGETVPPQRFVFDDAKGRDTIIAISAAPVVTTGRPNGAVAVWHDITAQERLLEDVRQVNEQLALTSLRAGECIQERGKLQALVDSIADEIWFCDVNGQLTLANARALGVERVEEIYAPTREWLLQGVPGRHGPRKRVVGEAPLLRSLRGETLSMVEGAIRHPQTGELLFRQASSSPIRDEAGQIVGAVAVVRDITLGKRAEARHKRAEESLRESEERLRLVVANSPDCIFGQDRDLRYTWIFNPTPPLTADDVLGRTDFDLLPSEQAQQLTEIKRNVLQTGIGTKVELRLSPGGEEHYFEAAYEPCRDCEGRIVGLAGHSRDVTERERLLGSLRHQTAELDAMLISLVEPLLVCTLGGTVARTNPALIALIGFDPVGMPLDVVRSKAKMRYPDGRSIDPSDSATTARLPATRALRGETVLGERLLVTTSEGRDLVVLVSAAPIRKNGEVQGAVLTWRNITELERVLEESKELAYRAQQRAAELQSALDEMIVAPMPEMDRGASPTSL